MKQYSISFLSILFLSTLCFSQDFWIQKDSVNGSGKSVCASFVIDGQGFCLAGLDDNGFKRKTYSYNPIQDDWDSETSIGGPNADGLDRGSATGFAIGMKGYICLGQGETNPYFKDLWEYDYETGAWSQKADFIGSARRQAIGFTINDIAYVGTGQDQTGLKKDFYKYDPSNNTWLQLNDFPGTARRQAVAFSMGNEGYVGTGDDGVLKNDFWMYIPSSDSWIQKANFPGTPRAGATGWGIFPTGFIATGEDINFEYKNDVWEYNYYANAWVQRADFIGSGRKNAISFVIDGIAYLGTGYDGEYLDDFYAYTGIVGLNELNYTVDSKVFPCPSIDFLTITISENCTNDSKVNVFALNGENVSEQVEISSTNNSFQLDIRNLAKGQYIYKIFNKNARQISSGKIVKIG
jgi:N-acetylneuraminic acid mutarotase